MELHGSVAQNLQLAVESSRRLRGHPIHKDTLAFWAELIKEARVHRVAGEADNANVDACIVELETVLSERASASP
jgi:hypothetical protein